MPRFTIVIFNYYKPRIAVAILDLYWMKVTWSQWQVKKILLFLKEFHENLCFKTTRFQGKSQSSEMQKILKDYLMRV